MQIDLDLLGHSFKIQFFSFHFFSFPLALTYTFLSNSQYFLFRWREKRATNWWRQAIKTSGDSGILPGAEKAKLKLPQTLMCWPH